MALSSVMIWQVQNGGSDANNSGGFRGGAAIAAPSAPTVNGSGSGGTVAANTYYFVVTYTDCLGDTVISGQTSVVTTGTTSSITVTSPSAATGALTWNLYCATTTGGPYFPQGTALVIGSNRSITTTPPTSGTQPRGVDYTLQNGFQLAIDNSAVTATTTGAASNTLTFTGGHTPVGVEVGNTFRALTGTNINAGVYEITAITTTTWTVAGAQNLTTGGGAGSAITGNMGGAFATPGQATAFATSNTSQIIYVQGFAGVYTLANGTVNTAGNRISTVGYALVGYTTNRNPLNTDTAPVFDAGAASMTVVAVTGNTALLHNVSITNSAARASVTGWTAASGQSMYRRVSVTGCATSLGNGGSNGTFVDCSDSGCGGMNTQQGAARFTRYASLSGTGGVGINAGASSTVQDCVVYGQAGLSSVGIACGANSTIANSVAVANTGTTAIGINANGAIVVVENCIVVGYSGTGATGYGGAGLAWSEFRNCADYNNTVAYLASGGMPPSSRLNCVSLSGDPFVSAAGLNFALNNTAGAGAACRQAGIPGTMLGLSTTGYRSIGTFEPAVAAAGNYGKKAGASGGKAG